MKYIIGCIITGLLLSLTLIQPDFVHAMMPEDLRQQIIEAEANGTSLEPGGSTYNIYIFSSELLLLLESKNASAYVAIDGYDRVTTIMTFTYLEKETANGWEEVTCWHNTVQGNYMAYITPQVTVTLGGRYRVRLSAYVYATTQYEQMQIFSSTVAN